MAWEMNISSSSLSKSGFWFETQLELPLTPCFMLKLQLFTGLDCMVSEWSRAGARRGEGGWGVRGGGGHHAWGRSSIVVLLHSSPVPHWGAFSFSAVSQPVCQSTNDLSAVARLAGRWGWVLWRRLRTQRQIPQCCESRMNQSVYETERDIHLKYYQEGMSE